MDNFAPNFDLYGGLSFEEWLEEDEKENITPRNKRFAAFLDEELNQL